MMDEESVHVLSLEDDAVGCAVAVEVREPLAESGRARQTHMHTCQPLPSVFLSDLADFP